MATTTALLKSASSTQKKIQAQADAEVAFNWENSAQTYEDYQAYANYLTDQSNKTSDPSQSLSYATKLRTANSSYVGNEIQRQTQAVIEGGSTNTDKYGKILDFYKQALDSGNDSLAQNLRSQLDSLSVTIQNEQQSAQTLARGMAADNVTTVQDYVATQQDIVKQWGDVYAKYGAAGLNDSLQQYAEQQGLKTAPSYFDVLAGVIGQPDVNGNYPPDSILGALSTAAAGLDPVNANKLRLDMNKVIDGTTKFDMPGISGGVSYTDIIDALDAQRAGQNIYSIGQKDGKNVFIKNSLDNYVWGQDANGQMRLISTYAPTKDNFGGDSNILSRDSNGNMLDSKGNVTKDASKAVRVKYNDLIQAAGFTIVGTNSDGSIQLAHSTKTAGTNLDVTGGGEFSAVIDDTGNLRFKETDAAGNTNVYSLGFGYDSNGNPTGNGADVQLKQLTGDNTSVFGDTGYFKSHANDVGQQLIKQIIGQTDVNFNPGVPSILHAPTGGTDVNPSGRALTTTDLLGESAMTQRLQGLAAASAAQSTANPQFQNTPQLQATPTYGLNQTPVPANSALKVSNAPPAPKISVAAPAPTPAITKVSVAVPTQQISSVGVAGPQPKLTVR